MLFLSYMHPPDLANTLHVALIWSKEIRFTSVRNIYHYCHFIENRLCLPLMCIPTSLMQIPKHVCVLLSAAAHAIYAGFGLDSLSILFCFLCVCVKVSTLCLCVMVVKKDFNKWIWEQTRADRHRQIGSWSVRDESSRHSKVAVLNELEAVVSPKGDR